MMNRLIILIWACLVPFAAQSASQDWSFAKAWIGKSPSDPISGYSGGLLGQAPIRSALQQALPKAEAKTLSQLDIESEITQVDQYIVVSQCKPRNCPAEMATIVIDVESRKLWVGMFGREASRVSTRWYGMSDAYSVLPSKNVQDFAKRHGN